MLDFDQVKQTTEYKEQRCTSAPWRDAPGAHPASYPMGIGGGGVFQQE